MKLLQKSALELIRLKLRLLAVFSPKLAARSAFRLFCTPQVRNLSEPSGSFLQAEIIDTVFENTAIRGYRWNRGGHTRVLILHGFESSVINFEHYVVPLTAKGYEVLAFDAPAHGKSGGKRMNAMQYRDFVHFIQREYGPATRFIAHSFGGLAISLVLAETPQNELMRLALVAPLTRTSTTLEQYYQLAGIRNPEVRQEMENIINELSGQDIEWFSINRALKQIRSSVLWAHDRSDMITPFRDLQPVIDANYPNVEFLITEGLGHRRIYRDPEVVRAITGFL
ncbi:MAG: alpha/beta fold hydrolase [Chitinophagaceae bacterium]